MSARQRRALGKSLEPAERPIVVDSCLTAFGRESAIAAVEASLSERRLAAQRQTQPRQVAGLGS